MKLMFKMVVLGLVMAFIVSIMMTLGLTKKVDSMSGIIEMLLTVAVFAGPSIYVNLQSSFKDDLSSLRKKGVIKKQIKKFLKDKERASFYRYDFDTFPNSEDDNDDNSGDDGCSFRDIVRAVRVLDRALGTPRKVLKGPRKVLKHPRQGRKVTLKDLTELQKRQRDKQCSVM